MLRITLNSILEKQKEVRQTLLSMIEPIGKAKGCLSYHVFRDIEKQHVFSILTEWKSRKALNLHIKSEIFGVLLGTRSLLYDPPSIEIHTVSNSEGMAMVNTLRTKSVLLGSRL